MKLDVVGRMPSQVLGVLSDLIQKLMGNDGELWLERTKRMLKGENPFAELVGASAPTDVWRDELVASARRKLKKFSKAWAAQVTAVPDSWTPEFLANAAKCGMFPAFVPEADINTVFHKAGYTKPNNWYYEKVHNGDIKGDNPTRLRRGWCLADFTGGTDYTDGTQVLPNDPWAPLITELRIVSKIVGAYSDTPSGSRFSITWDEWIQVVLAHMAAELQITRAQINLPTAMEWNFIGNVYAPHYGAHNMWTWFQDQFGGSYVLIGGHRDGGGLASIDFDWHGSRHDVIVARPLVRFVR